MEGALRDDETVAAFNEVAARYDQWYETPLGALADARAFQRAARYGDTVLVATISNACEEEG